MALIALPASQINATSYDERTYGDIANQAEAVHGALESLGVCAGDRLCLMVDNLLELLPMLVGAACANVGVVYETPGYAVEKASEVLIEWMKNIDFTAICCELSNVDSALELKHVIVLGEGKNLPSGTEAAVILWSQLIKMGTKARRLSALSVEYQANRICYVAPTSGTVGKPRMVVHCHDSLVASVQSISHQQHMGLTVEDVFLCTSPLGHGYALFDCVCKAIVQGATCAFLEKADTDALLEAIQRLKVSTLNTVPYLARCLLEHPQRSHYDLIHLRYLATATTYISEDVARRLFRELNLKSYVQTWLGSAETPRTLSCSMEERKMEFEVYGKTEIVFISGGLHDSPPRFTSVGRLGVGLEAMVIDTETKKPLGPMQHGELVIRGPGLMRGYLGMEDEPYTDPEGWYRTGEL
ncbi:uncharacterized protein LOC119405933 [Rhipicephalus sanguineus]|uniref:uncharacterized protein LOC119405933 n=1 Tax=Rhipicephalus sanguineus TaxID=34632 RepID=UPI001894F3E4|nr:uncharacterized protein LOC119405933 [Rhipicephalus sanguineus]